MAKHGPDEGWRQHVLNNVLPRMEASSTFEPAPANPQPFSTGMHFQPPQHDPIDWLPPAAAERLRLLRQRDSDSHAVVPPFADLHEKSIEKQSAAAELKRLTDHPQDGGLNLPDDNRSVITAKRTLAKATDDLERLKQLSEVRTAAWQTASQPKAAVEDYLRRGVPGNCTLEAVEIEPPKMLKGETVLDGIERLRRRVRELRADLHRIASAPYPSSHAKQRMRAQIEALAQRGAPSVSRLIELDGPVDFQTTQMQSQVYNVETPAVAFAEVLDIALVAWLHKDALVAALDREISTEADDKAALTHEARQKAEAEVQGDLLAVEREECALVWQAQAQNLPCEHRQDVSVLALLSITLLTAPHAEASGTTPGYSWPLRR